MDAARVEQFLANAAECRRLAEQASSPEYKERWLKIADDWVRLAEATEADDLTLVQDLATRQRSKPAPG